MVGTDTDKAITSPRPQSQVGSELGSLDRNSDKKTQHNHIAAARHGHKDNYKHSPGEKIFDAITYQGIGTLATAAVSIVLTDMFKNGAGKPVFDKWAASIGPTLGKLRGIKDPKQAVVAAHSALIFGGLFWGGTLLTIPVKKLEENKLDIVKWIDDKYNSHFTPSEQTLEIQEATHKRLEQEAAPSWGNLLLARGLITATIAGVVFALAGKDKTAADNLTKLTSETMQKSSNTKISKLGKSEKFRDIVNLGLIDLYQSAIGGVVLYLTTHHYKAKQKKKLLSSAGNDNEAVAQEAPIAEAQQAAETRERIDTPESELNQVQQVIASGRGENQDKNHIDAKEDNWQDKFSEPAPHSDKIIEMASTQQAQAYRGNI